MNLRQRLVLDSHLQKVHNETVHTGDRVVGWSCCIGLILFILWEISGRYL